MVPLPERMVPILPDPQVPWVPQVPLPDCMVPTPDAPDPMFPQVPLPLPPPEPIVPMLDPQVPSVPQVPLPKPTGLAPVKANVIANAKEIPVQCFILTF